MKNSLLKTERLYTVRYLIKDLQDEILDLIIEIETKMLIHKTIIKLQTDTHKQLPTNIQMAKLMSNLNMSAIYSKVKRIIKRMNYGQN